MARILKFVIVVLAFGLASFERIYREDLTDNFQHEIEKRSSKTAESKQLSKQEELREGLSEGA